MEIGGSAPNYEAGSGSELSSRRSQPEMAVLPPAGGVIRPAIKWFLRKLLFVDVLDHMESLPVDVVQSRLSNIYNTVGLVSALLLSVSADPFINPPECMAESGQIYLDAFGASSVVATFAHFLAIVYCTVYLMVVYGVNGDDLKHFVQRNDFVLGLPVTYALLGCLGFIVGGFQILFACYSITAFYALSIVFVAVALLPFLYAANCIVTTFKDIRESRVKKAKLVVVRTASKLNSLARSASLNNRAAAATSLNPSNRASMGIIYESSRTVDDDIDTSNSANSSHDAETERTQLIPTAWGSSRR